MRRSSNSRAIPRLPGWRAVRPRFGLLWEVCKIPDFRKTMTEAHTRLLARIYGHLMAPTERLPTDWVARQLAQLDCIDGDIDTLMARIAHVRTWTFVSHRPDWLSDSQDWQERARAIEDRLSDALHDRLTQRFVDRRSAVLLRLKDKESVLAAVTEAGEVVVEGEFVGRLEGFRFNPDGTSMGDDRRALVSAAARALKGEIATRTRRLIDETDDAFAVDGQGRLTWRDVAIAHLVAGPSILQPRIEAMVSEFLTGEQRGGDRALSPAMAGSLSGEGIGADLRPRPRLPFRPGARARLPAYRGAWIEAQTRGHRPDPSVDRRRTQGAEGIGGSAWARKRIFARAPQTQGPASAGAFMDGSSRLGADFAATARSWFPSPPPTCPRDSMRPSAIAWSGVARCGSISSTGLRSNFSGPPARAR